MKVTLLEQRERESVGWLSVSPACRSRRRRPACQILVDHAVAEGWTTARACAVVELYGRRCRRWQHPEAQPTR